MAELSRSYDGPGIGKGGIIVGALVLLVLVSLFFIPEIIEFQKSFGSGTKVATKKTKSSAELLESELDRPKDKEEIKDIPAVDDSASPDNLDTLASMLDKKEILPAAPEAEDTTRASLAVPSKSKQAKKGQGKEVSWDKIRASDSKDALMKARKVAIEIAKKMPTRNAGTRYALFNFASGVDFLFDHGPQILSAREASLYLNSLDQAVGKAMGREAVDRSIVLKWSKVNFGPAITPSGDRLDIVPFNPHLTLSWIKLRQRALHGLPDPRAKMRVDVGGFLFGKEISKLELVNGRGTVERRVLISRPIKSGGNRLFRFSVVGNQPWTLRVRDKSGHVYQKTYDFYGASSEFPFYDRRFHLPFRMSFATPTRFVPEDVDPRLDGYFLTRVWRGKEEALRYAISSGDEGGGGLADSAAGQLFSTF